MPEYIVNDEKEMVSCGKKLALNLRGGDIVLLSGELGAGKTTLIKGIAAGLGVKEKITSPTFALMNVYDIPASRDSSASLGMTASREPVARVGYPESRIDDFFAS